MKSYNNYNYYKVPFKKFMANNLINEIKTFNKKEKRREIFEFKYKILSKNEILIQNEHFSNKKSTFSLKNNVISDIFKLIIQPDFKEKLKPYMKNKKYNSNCYKYAIQEYIYKKNNHSYYKIQQAFLLIKKMLKETV